MSAGGFCELYLLRELADPAHRSTIASFQEKSRKRSCAAPVPGKSLGPLLPHPSVDSLHRLVTSQMSPRTMGTQHKKVSVAHFHALRLHRGSVKRTAQRDPASSRHSCRPALPTGWPKNVRPAPALATGSTRDSKSRNASSVDGYGFCMGLGGYMTHIAAEVAVFETTRKQAESEPTRGNKIEVLTEQRSTAHSSHIINSPPRRCLFRALPSRSWHWMASSVP